MKHFYARKKIIVAVILIVLYSVNSLSQSLIEVNVSSNLFTPASITINVGDTVQWTNTQGNHNVNGTTGTFPSNPESFGNSVAGPGWVYTYVFNTAGTYQYHCDPHAGFGMTGTIMVNASTSIFNTARTKTNLINNIFPVPASDYVTLEISDQLMTSKERLEVRIYNLTGKEVMFTKVAVARNLVLDIQNLPESVYIIRLFSNSEIVGTSKIIIN